MRLADRHDDDAASFDIDRLVAAGEANLASGDDEDLIVLVVDVLRRLRRPGRQDALEEPQAVAGVRTVLDDARADRAAEGLLALAWPNHPNPHRPLFYWNSVGRTSVICVAPPASRRVRRSPVSSYEVVAARAARKACSCVAAASERQARRVVASGPTLIVEPAITYGPRYVLQPVSPVSVPSAPNWAVSWVSATTETTASRPLLMPVTRQTRPES